MSTTPLVEASLATSPAPSSNAADEAVRILLQAGDGADTAFGTLGDLTVFEKQRVQTLIEERGLVFSPESKDALAQGRLADLKRLLRQAAETQTRDHASTEVRETRARDQAGAPTASKAPDSAPPTVHLPLAGDEVAGPVDSNFAVPATPVSTATSVTSSPAAKPASTNATARATPAPTAASAATLTPDKTAISPCTDPTILARVRRELLALVTIAGRPSLPESGKAASERQALLGQTVPAHYFVRNFPANGRSGTAAGLPLMQFSPDGLRATLMALGITNLADFLVRGLLASGRRLLASLFDLPTATLLLAIYRAELLDLPIEAGRATPHPKDLLLLAQLGIVCVGDLAQLSRLIDASPERLELLWRLIAALQKAAPDYIGKQPITRQDLKTWAQAAARRGSDIDVPTTAANGRLDHASCVEAALAWYLAQRYPNNDALWDGMACRGMAWLAACGTSLAADVERRIFENGTAVLRDVFAVPESDERERLLLDRRTARKLELIKEDNDFRAAQRVLDEQLARLQPRGWSLFTDLRPAVGERRTPQGRVGFWMEPVADTNGARLPGDRGRLPASLNPIYVTIDPDSGALEPLT